MPPLGGGAVKYPGDIVKMYRNGSAGCWTPTASLVPGHNQACERLIGNLKRSKDINELVTLHE